MALTDASQDERQNERFVRETGLAGEVARVAEPAIEGLGFRLVRVVVSGRDGGTVQIMAERPDGTMSVEDCARLSRDLSPLLDAWDGLSERYNLEVSSPGIDRPLTRPSDFETWAGFEAKLEPTEPIEGRKRFRGRIEGLEAGEVRLEVDLPDHGGAVVIGLPVTMIATAKLVLTDALLRTALARSRSRSEGKSA